MIFWSACSLIQFSVRKPRAVLQSILGLLKLLNAGNKKIIMTSNLGHGDSNETDLKLRVDMFEGLVRRSKEFHCQPQYSCINDLDGNRKANRLQNRIETLAAIPMFLSGDGDELLLRKYSVAHHAELTSPILSGVVADGMNKYLTLTQEETRTSPIPDVSHFVCRLLTHRPVVFMNRNDFFMLQDGSDGVGNGQFETLLHGYCDGNPLSGRNLLGYEEIEFSALVSMAVPTFFVNNGSRNNMGGVDPLTNHQEFGVYVGSVGARFEKRGVMDSRFILVTREQNTSENGYGVDADKNSRNAQLLKIWYDMICPSARRDATFPSYESVKKLQLQDSVAFQHRYSTFTEMGSTQLETVYFDKLLYKGRMKLTITSFLRCANNQLAHLKRYSAGWTSVHVRAVGLGLGVWKIISEQNQLLLDAYAEVLREESFPFISDLEFMYFGRNDGAKCGGVGTNETFCEGPPGSPNSIRIHFTLGNPADKLDDNKLLVAQYAWDGNAFPGNEYWLGSLSASGDPAAACCSTISELQNPCINSDAFVPERVLVYT